MPSIRRSKEAEPPKGHFVRCIYNENNETFISLKDLMKAIDFWGIKADPYAKQVLIEVQSLLSKAFIK